jgi:hypothetical protein
MTRSQIRREAQGVRVSTERNTRTHLHHLPKTLLPKPMEESDCIDHAV